jgi:hypothetical protein
MLYGQRYPCEFCAGPLAEPWGGVSQGIKEEQPRQQSPPPRSRSPITAFQEEM